MCRLTHPLRRRLRVAAAVVTSLALSTTLVTFSGDIASADTRSSSRVVGRGDIITTIWAAKRTRRTRSAAVPQRCRDVRFTDNDIEMLVGAISWDTESEPARRYAALVSEFILQEPEPGAPATEFDLIATYCGDSIIDIRAVPRLATTLAQQVARSMITRLPEPVVRLSPPDGSSVPVGEPVFISVDPQHWTSIDATLTLGNVTASVRATPTHLRMFSGESGTTYHVCEGPGRPYDPTSLLPARLQASTRGACTLVYRSPFLPGPDSTPRLGSISVLWRTEWRTDDGPWNSLGLIPRTRIFVRPVVELATPITRSAFPIPSARR